MAEAVVVLLVSKIATVLGEEALKQVSSLFCQKTSQLRQVRSKFKEILDEFEVMRAFLRQADEREEDGNPTLQQAWVNKVREAAYEVEDVIDEFTFSLGKRQYGGGFRGFVRKAVRRTRNVGPWLDIADRLQDIETRLRQLSNMKDRYGIKITTEEGGGSTVDDGTERWKRLAESSHFIRDDEIVGIERNKATLTGWLVDDEEPGLRVISVWGMGGLGKTTLATKVYQTNTVKEKFDCRAWIAVSQTYTADDLLRRIIKEFVSNEEMNEEILHDIDAMGHRRLVEMFQDYLRKKKYLVILDDVWSTNVWREISDAFVDNNCSSRIVFTSRIYNVALLAAKGRVMEIQPLDEDESWTLFRRKAFHNDANRTCPRELVCWGRKIVEKCQGLPLAIASVGSMLSLTEEREAEWKRVHDDINWELTHNTEFGLMNSILSLSLQDLPYYLRHCFLYCSIFPEDFLIKRKKLIRLWIAEGLIEKEGRNNKTMEDVADDNLNQLVYRCMLQIAERNPFGRVKTCRVHDVMRELALSICKREKFCVVYENPEAKLDQEYRRLSAYKKPSDIQLWQGKMSWLRSLLLFSTVQPWASPPLLSSVLSNSRLLRVLDLRGVPISAVPEEVFNLFNLHYLGLRDTKVKVLPKSVRKLRNLVTLDILYTEIGKLPRGLTKLTKLRHFYVGIKNDSTHLYFDSFSGVPAPRGIWDLKDLQSLREIEADEEIVRHLGIMTQLRSFGIWRVRRSHCAELCAALAKMERLDSLGISVAANEEAGEVLELETLSPTPPLLQKIWLWGRLGKGTVPEWFGSLTNLTHLWLCRSGLRRDQDPLPSLQSLPNLMFLHFIKAYDGQSMCFRAGWFPKLKKLYLVDMPRLAQVEIEDGALITLQLISLRRCVEMKEVPRGIGYLNTLQELYLREMPEEFLGRIRGNEEDRIKVKHIPLITHDGFHSDGKWFREILTVPS